MQLLNQLTVYRADYRYLQFKYPAICLSSDSVGDIVFVSGDMVGDSWVVEKADPSDGDKMPGVGVLIEKNTSTSGIVQIAGPVFGIFSGLQSGKPYCMDYSGIRLGVPGLNGNSYVMRQFIGFALSDDVFLINPDFNITIING